jgi:MFS transporter, CP family, cyanate transporter
VKVATLSIALIVTAGVVASLNVGKLPPAFALLREEFGMTLVEASFLMSFFQLAGMLFGLFGGMVADRFGPRRVMLSGMLITAVGCVGGAFATDAATLLASRAVESTGFILTVLPGPALMARTVNVASLRLVMGFWGAYMPAGMALGLALSPLVYQAHGWRPVWWIIGGLSLLVAAAVAAFVPADPADRKPSASIALVRETLTTPGPWLLALTFGFYSSQWIGVFSFLPTLYDETGVAPALAGTLTAVGAAVNVIGNLMSGALLQRGFSRAALIIAGSLSMLVGAWLCFGSDAPFAVRYAGVLLFSSMAGLIPGTLFASTASFAPHAGAVSTTTGLMQQGSAFGQFVSPPVIAAVAAASGGWHNTWIATGTMAVMVLALAFAFTAVDRRGTRAARR